MTLQDFFFLGGYSAEKRGHFFGKLVVLRQTYIRFVTFDW